MKTQKMKTTYHSKYTDQNKLNALTASLLENIDDIYDYFNVRPRRGAKVIFSKCFIHGGDNTSALNLYYNADYRIHWKCRTHDCQNHFGTSLLSMVRGALSHVKYGWTNKGDESVHLDDTIEFLLNRFGLKFGDLKGESNVSHHQDFVRMVNGLETSKPKGKIPKEEYIKRVTIPSQYYINRGYTTDVLNDYDIGTCLAQGKPMHNRSVVPIYDETGQVLVGVTGRSLFEQCAECKYYHDPAQKCHVFPKWRHSGGFEKEKVLYNYWRALPSIHETSSIILVESAGNVWRLEEAGIHNSVAMFGVTLNPPQLSLIDESGAMDIYIIVDNDEAGKQASAKIYKQCERTYRCHIINISKGDIGDMTVEEINQEIKPEINV